MVDESRGVLCIKLFQRPRHNQEVGRRIIPVLDKPACAFIRNAKGRKRGASLGNNLRRGLVAQRIFRAAHRRHR
jgi:hypothetical protein